jgi:hypothetical protein
MKAAEYLKENSDWFDKSPGGEKLYFESEVIKMMEKYSSPTEISDEEIEKSAKEWYDKKGLVNYKAEIRAWVSACKWYREQLKKTSI